MVKKIKGVVLAGGTGSRLHPLTKVTNKHLLPVGAEPMIFHPIKKLTEAGVREILIVTGIEHMGAIVQLLGSGRDFNCQFTYRVQDEAGGIAQALGLAEQFVGSDLCAVLLGDNIFEDAIVSGVNRFRETGEGACVYLTEVSDPERFGVAVLENGVIRSIIEKPQKAPSRYAVTGIYLYDSQVFSMIKQLKPSARGELEITDINNFYLANQQLRHEFLKGYWTDAGTLPSLARANFLVTQTSASSN